MGTRNCGKAIALLCEYALNELLFIRLQAFVYTPNLASVRVLEKNGFEREGLLRKYVRKDGRIYDCFLYARLRNP